MFGLSRFLESAEDGCFIKDEESRLEGILCIGGTRGFYNGTELTY